MLEARLPFRLLAMHDKAIKEARNPLVLHKQDVYDLETYGEAAFIGILLFRQSSRMTKSLLITLKQRFQCAF